MSNLRVKSIKSLVDPKIILQEIPSWCQSQIQVFRTQISNILSNQSNLFLVCIGPCSIHDPDAAIVYAQRLKQVSQKYKDKLLIVMRVYFEKPRTTIGWKGLLYDPNLDNSCDIEKGIRLGRKVMVEISEIGIPIACEFLDTIIPQYFSDLVSYAAIGARTTESQIHRQLASGLSMPVGFKNTTDGNIKIASDSVICAKSPHTFLGVNEDGKCAIVETTGNEDCHIILRGANSKPNYDSSYVDYCRELLPNKKVLIDCSHDNSQKNYLNQISVCNQILKQIQDGQSGICGVMIESHLQDGKQNLDFTNPQSLKYGVSITDGCLGWEKTLLLLEKIYVSL